MYESFYELRKPPFRLTPDPHFFFGSRTHKRSLAYLQYAVQQGEGFVVITGGPGTGKTELMLNLIEELPQPRTILAKIVSTNLNADDLLQLVAASFKLSTDGLGKGVLLKKLENFFISCARRGKQVFLLIDEAHNLSTSSLLELSMLSNFQLGEKAILRCFLLGQEPLEQKLEDPELAHLKQRIIASAHLHPMGETETREYIEHRLTQAGWKMNPRFHDSAYPPIYKFTGGIPRQINFFCNRLLLQGYLDELDEIDIDVVRCVIKEILDEATVAHAPCDLAEICGGPEPPLKIVDDTAAVVNQTLAPKAQETTLDHHVSSRDTDTFLELSHGGAHRLLRVLTEDRQADRLLRASAAFYVKTSSARDAEQSFPRLVSPDRKQQNSVDTPSDQTLPCIVEANHRLAPAWKWAAVVGIAALGIFMAPQLRFTEEVITPSDTASNGKTNTLTVAEIDPVRVKKLTNSGMDWLRQSETIMPVEKDSMSVSSVATVIDPLQIDKKLTMPETHPPQIIAKTRPSPAIEQLESEPFVMLKAPEIITQEKKAENVSPKMSVASTNLASMLPQAQLADDSNQKPPADSEVITTIPRMQKTSPELSTNRLPLVSQEPANTSKASEIIRVAVTPLSTKRQTVDAPPVIPSLPPLSSLTFKKLDGDQPKRTDRPARHERNPIIGNPVESITTAETGIPAVELKILLSRLTLAYETGNLRQLVSVFADDARSNDKTSLNEIEDDYRKLFNVTDMRRMMISGIQWSKSNNKMRGKGNFQILVREKGAGRVAAYDGSIKLDVAQSARGIVITQFDYRYDE